MPKLALINTNFGGGELSPYLLGRVDVSKYANGAARMQDFHPIVQGGAVTRPGLRFAGMAKGYCRLIPFVFSRDVAYQIELGSAGYLRIWRSGTRNQVCYPTTTPPAGKKPSVEKPSGGPTTGTVPIEFATPYTANELREVTYEQAEDTLFLFHYAHPPYRLQRQADQLWRFEPVPFVTLPFSEIGYSGSVALTLSDSTVGTGRTVTALSAAFLEADVGRDLEAGTGSATITGFSTASVVTVDITSAFETTAIASWTLSDSPQGVVYPNQKDPVGSIVYLDMAVPRAADITLSGTSGAITITASASVFLPSDDTRPLVADTGLAVLTYVSGTSMTATTARDFLRTEYGAGAWGIGGAGWRHTDVGSYVRLNGGLFQITEFVNVNRVKARVIIAASAVVAAPAGAWSLEAASIDAERGWPRCGALHEQRLWMAGSVAEPQSVWASRIAEYLDFEPGLLDADGFGYTLNTNQRNAISHLVSGTRLFPLTPGQEVSLRGGNEKAIGPTNIQRSNESRYGANLARPVPIGKEVLFVQAGDRKVRALGFAAAIDAYDSPDRTVFAEHVTQSGIVEMTYQPQEHSLLYAVRNDGQIAVCAYDVAQEVVAWSRYTTAGQFRSVSCVPYGPKDEVWVVVQRLFGNETYYCIEVFDEDFASDCAGLGVTGHTRFPNGTTVAVRDAGVNKGPLTISGGAVDVESEVPNYVEVGLPFVPELELLPPDLGGGSTMQGSNLSVHEVAIRVLDTATLEVNGEVTDFREFGESLLDQPPPGMTGDYRVLKLTDSFIKDRLVIRQPLPFKAHVSAVIRKVTANDV